MNSQLRTWAERYVPKFNELAERYDTGYYTQSPLMAVEDDVDTIVIGINPLGASPAGRCRKLSVDEFLSGNPCWGERFVGDKINPKWKFNSNAHFFLGDNYRRRHPLLDDDKRVVWTNITPFDSPGKADIRHDLLNIGIESNLELITLLRPRRVVLFGAHAFSVIDKFVSQANLGEKYVVEHTRLFKECGAEIGRINGVPVICTTHPSSRAWELHSHFFTPVIIHLHSLVDVCQEGSTQKSLQEVKDTIRKELKHWQQTLTFDD